jgi:hypothetical protein
MAFCRDNHLSSTGSKKDLQLRAEAFLSHGTVPGNLLDSKIVKRREKMPKEFHRDTVIGTGWHCSQELRHFFEREIGPQFHFNRTMREFIFCEAGRTLQDAIETWKKSRKRLEEPKQIDEQFEYNRHVRDYFQKHPHATLNDMIRAWKEKKANRGEH